MAYENEIDYQQTSEAIQSDLLLNATDITSTELLESADGVIVPVIKEEQGVPRMKRVTIGTLTEGVQSAANEARAMANTASAQASRAQSAADSAMQASSDARDAIEEIGSTVEDMQDTIDAYLSSVDQSVKQRIAQLGQMAATGQLDVRVESFQLFDDFVRVTGYTGTYEQFLILIGQTGGGGTIDVDDAMSSTSTNPVQNKVITTSLAGKQDMLEFLTSSDINAIINL